MSANRCWCCGTAGIEHQPYLEVVAMNADAAKALIMPDAVKVECIGQADADRYRFGARVYRLFHSQAAWERYRSANSAGEMP